MKYMGSKRRIAKDILPIILKDRKPGQWYVEPFAGGMNSICEVYGNRIANEYNEYVTAMWDALINKDWSPPNNITEDQYSDIKKNKGNYPKELVGFVGVAMSFGSSWFKGYARNKRGTNYAVEGRNNLMRQVQKLKGVVLSSKSYIDIEVPPKSIIYCDPPIKELPDIKTNSTMTYFGNGVG